MPEPSNAEPSPLKRSALHAVRWLTVATAFSAALQVLQAAILARLLLQEEIGIAAIVTSLGLFSAVLLDFGVTNALVQRTGVSAAAQHTLFWLNAAAAVAFCAAFWLLAEPLAGFYNRPKIAPLVQLMSLGFLAMPLGQQYRALHQKRLEFSVIARNELWASLASAAVAIGAALAGLKAGALVLGFLTRQGVQNLLFWWNGRHLYRPALTFRWAEARPFLGYGLYQSGSAVMGFIVTYLDTFFIGKAIGLSAAGTFDMARNLLMRPVFILNPIITRITFPVFAQMQDDVPRLRNAYRSTLTAVALVNFPLFTGCWVAAEPLVRILLGPDWLTAVPVVRILCGYALLRAVINPAGSLLYGVGAVRPAFIGSVVTAAITLGAIVLGAPLGLLGLSAALTAAMLLVFLMQVQFLVLPVVRARLAQQVAPLLRVLLLAAAAAVPGWWLARLPLPAVLQLGLAAAACALLYAALCWWLMPPARRLALDLIPDRVRHRPLVRRLLATHGAPPPTGT